MIKLLRDTSHSTITAHKGKSLKAIEWHSAALKKLF